MNTLNVYQRDNHLVSNISWEIVSKNKIEDIEFVTNQFKKLNEKYI